MQSNVFLVFPPAAGGNHLRNILLYSTTVFNNTADNIQQKYSSNTVTVHCKDIGSSLYSENLTQTKLINASTTKHNLFYGHFAELLSFKHTIDQLPNKKFICISVRDDASKNLLNQRKNIIGTPQLDEYHLGEQTFLYENLVYRKIFDLQDLDIMDISLNELFFPDLTVPMQLIENFLDIKIDMKKVDHLHAMWLEKNCVLTT